MIRRRLPQDHSHDGILALCLPLPMRLQRWRQYHVRDQISGNEHKVALDDSSSIEFPHGITHALQLRQGENLNLLERRPLLLPLRVLNVVFNLLGVDGGKDEDFFDTGRGEKVEGVVDERCAGDGEEALKMSVEVGVIGYRELPGEFRARWDGTSVRMSR